MNPDDYILQLQDGTELPGLSPVVVLGPNGSGKTRQTRTVVARGVPINFVNALRNTRVNPQIPAMGFMDAKTNFASQKSQAKSQHWEFTSEFDYLLSQLLAEDAMAAKEYMRNVRSSGPTDLPPLTALGHVEEIWGDVFPGRELFWKDWAPMVKSTVMGDPTEYSANQMSDGEKAALYLAGRVFSEDPGIIVVDEPETHLHSLLAARLWDALEARRTDLRFVYVTHDLTFALSRANAQFVLASPKQGLRVLDLGGELPGDVAEVLLGSASLSFYARRVVFCEGMEQSIDNELYNAWFNGQDTVVRSVGSSEMVLRCVDALGNSGIANSLESAGIIDRDFHPDTFLAALPNSLHVLDVHEVESIFCLPSVVSAVAKHLGKVLDPAAYKTKLGTAISESDRRKIVLERWKRRLEPNLEGLVSSVSSKTKSIEDIGQDIPEIFDHSKWSFSPEKILAEEKARVDASFPNGSVDAILQLASGKKLLALAAGSVGLNVDAYKTLIVSALKPGEDEALVKLGQSLEAALAPHLPARTIPDTAEPVAID